MKQLLGKTDLWRFPIMCEEIWTGVAKETFPVQSNVFEKHVTKGDNHVSSSPQIAQQAPVIS